MSANKANNNMAGAPAASAAPAPAPAAPAPPVVAPAPANSKSSSPTRKVKRKNPYDKRIDAMVADAKDCLLKIRFYTHKRNKILERLKRIAASKAVNAELAEMDADKKKKNKNIIGSLTSRLGKIGFGKK